jgi:nucleoside 2-deoxyribosyltransferase
MKVYLAAQFHWKEEIRIKKLALEARGVIVTSTWTDEIAAPNCSLKDFSGDYHSEMALRDLREIDEADALILFTVDPDTLTRRGGRHVEFGYALGKGKVVAVVGPRENIFHHLPILQFNTWEEAVTWMVKK